MLAVPLAMPASARLFALSAPMMRASVCPEFSLDASDLSFDLTPASNKESADALRDRFDELAAKIDWSNASVQLANGQLTILPAEIVNEIQAFAQQPHIVQRAAELGLDPIKLVIALIASRVSARNRAAARVLRGIKGKRAISELRVDRCDQSAWPNALMPAVWYSHHSGGRIAIFDRCADPAPKAAVQDSQTSAWRQFDHWEM
jgi:hypothetical protein